MEIHNFDATDLLQVQTFIRNMRIQNYKQDITDNLGEEEKGLEGEWRVATNVDNKLPHGAVLESCCS